ncbi:MAG: hypothetical protein ACAH59_06960 [Pseudobdellovibrionaceae bacterium]
MKAVLLSSLLLLLAPLAFGYATFIGYGYSSCLTCHINGQGAGPLNDYGRALWSAEIASRALYPKSMTDEEIAAQSGFLGSVELPTWFRPYFKYRELHLTRNFRGPNEIKSFYRMQQDLGLTVSDSVGKYLATITYGNLNERSEGTPNKRYLAREYYLRAEIVETWWLYVGLMEKVFGIRRVEHTSNQRSPQGFNYYLNSTTGHAQSEGVMVQKIAENWEFTGNVFWGNPHDIPEVRHKGAGFMTERDVGEKQRLGASYQNAKSEINERELYALHYRQGFTKGAGMIFEYGFINNADVGQQKTRGSYNLLEALVPFTRGYNLRTEVERYNADFKASVADQWRWSVGILAFPIPRLELRADVENRRAFSNQTVEDDNWTFLGQIHVSL